MPYKLKRPCKAFMCPEMAENKGYCIEHQSLIVERKQSINHRETHKQYNTTRWRKYRVSFLKANPLCVMCKPKLNASTVVDHIIPHKGDIKLFWDKSNHQALCYSCHNRKTAKYDGGFKNK